MQLQFLNGWVLFLIWVLLALAAAWLLLFRGKRRAMEKFLAEPMLVKLVPSARPSRFYWQLVLVAVGLLLLLVAAARPQWGVEERTVFQRGRDLIIALDVSRSMLAQDVHPDRLQRAKADIQDLLRELRGDRAALFAFRGLAVQLCPLTTDYAYMEQVLDDVSPESAPRGETNLGDAIEKALVAFETDEGAHRALILISDGEDLAGKAKAAAEKAKKAGVVIFTVGLGDPKGATIPGVSKGDPHLTYQGKEVVTKLQHETLKDIAETTGGAYVPVGVANVKLGKLYRDHLSKIAARDIEESLQKRMIDRFQFFLLPGIVALLAGAFLSRGRLAKREKNISSQSNPALPGKTALIICALGSFFMSMAPQSPAQTNRPVSAPPVSRTVVSNAPSASKGIIPERVLTGRRGASKGQQLYRLGLYGRSAEAYLQAMTNSSLQLQNTCLFNAGCAYFRAGDYASAAQSFSQLGSKDGINQAGVFYNLGCSTFRMAEQSDKMGTNRPPELKPVLLEKAGQAFQRSWRAEPGHKNAAANLAAITNMLPKARQEAKMQALMAKYGGQPPSQVADTMLQGQRKIFKALPAILTNPAPERITRFEELAEQQRVNADLLIPLKMTLAGALNAQGPTGQQQIAQMAQHVEAVQNAMDEGYEKLRNIDNRSFNSVRNAERGVYNLWKAVASFGQLLNEDIMRQTNTIDMTTSRSSATTQAARDKSGGIDAIQAEQGETRLLTQLFSERFSQSVPEAGSASCGKLPGMPSAPLRDENAAQTTNETAQISAAARTNILALADQAVKAQARAGEYLSATNLQAALPEQRHSYDLLKEIEKLLPKDKNQQDQQNQDQKEQKQDQQQNPQDKEQNKQDQKQPDQQPPPPQEQPPPPQDKQQQPQKEQPAEEQKDKNDKEMTPEQLRALLEKALQREKEHREDKMRDEYIPPSPVDRDW